jgi:uncharacterized protein (DUF1697 family)
MNIFAAMLRGINVGGRNRVRMEELRGLFESLRCRDVRTYVQSGNVVFASSVARPATIAARIEKEILTQHGLDVVAIVRTADELQGVIANNTFAQQSRVDPKESLCHFSATGARGGVAREPSRTAVRRRPLRGPRLRNLSALSRGLWSHAVQQWVL